MNKLLITFFLLFSSASVAGDFSTRIGVNTPTNITAKDAQTISKAALIRDSEARRKKVNEFICHMNRHIYIFADSGKFGFEIAVNEFTTEEVDSIVSHFQKLDYKVEKHVSFSGKTSISIEWSE